MEITERLPLKPIHWLSQLSYSEFVERCITKKTSVKDCESLYSCLQHFCRTNIKTNGITKRIYSHSLNTPTWLGGRLFSGGSLQGVPLTIRGLIMKDITWKNILKHKLNTGVL